MKSIYKYHLGHEKNMVVKMPKDAKILCVQEQFNKGVIWAIVDPEEKLENRYFKSFLTGKEFNYHVTEIYLGTYQVDDGNSVIHVFEVVK